MSFESNKLVTLGQAVELSNEVLGKVAAKNYLTEVDSYTLTKQTNPDTGYTATYQLFKGQTAIGDKINIPKDMVVESGSVVNITYDTSGSTAALKEGDVDVTTAIIGKGNQATSNDAGVYVKLVIANSDDTAIYIKATDLVDVYTNGDGITITNNVVAINIDSSNANGLSVGANGLALAGAVASTSGAGGSAGAMSAADKEKLNNADVTAYTEGNGINITNHAVSVEANNGIEVTASGVGVKASDGVKVTATGVGVKIASSGANGLSVDSNGVSLATASSTGYIQASGYYVEGTTYYTDSTGATEVDTTGFTGNTDVSSYYVVKTATSGAMSAADKTKLDGFVIANSSDVTSAIAGLISL